MSSNSMSKSSLTINTHNMSNNNTQRALVFQGGGGHRYNLQFIYYLSFGISLVQVATFPKFL